MDNNLGPFRLNPKGYFKQDEHYKYLDVVKYNGSSYMCCNYDTIDKIDCVGILPIGQEQSETYWFCLAEKGEKGEKAVKYDSFINLSDNNWNYDLSDKVIITIDMVFNSHLNITNVYDGCCGVILTKNENVVLPENSDLSVDFNYMRKTSNSQYYLYTFIYGKITTSYKFIWNRTIINE